MIDPLDSPEHLLFHSRNLEQKKKRVIKGGPKELVDKACQAYASYVSKLDKTNIEDLNFDAAVESLNLYVDEAKVLESSHSLFNWRSDYASSIIPEFFCRLIDAVLSKRGIEYFLVTKNAVVDLTVSAARSGGWQVRHKNQDFCVGLRKDSLIVDGNEMNFVVPIVAAEFKTNIDINKLNGLDFSAERLKRSFPEASYFLFTETIDFSLSDNFAAMEIDEVFVLRKQMRSVSRKTKAPLEASVFLEGVQQVVDIVCQKSEGGEHVYDRLASGKLINFKGAK
jgi:hypothetical protein